MEKHKVYNLIILDESGSMAAIKQATINGFNELVQTIKGFSKQFPEQEQLASLITFNGRGIKEVFKLSEAENILELNSDTFLPDSLTPLFDAIGTGILQLKNALKEQKNYHVLVTILTDGEENDSKEFNGAAIKKLISEMKREGWTFTYIGANHDVEAMAISISISQSNAMKFEVNEADSKAMWDKDKISRQNYNCRVRDNEDTEANYFEKD